MKQSIFFTFILGATVTHFSCQQNPKASEYQAQVETEKSADIPTNEEGLKLFIQNCYACHNPLAASHEEILAPPMVGVKQMYKLKFPDRENFIERMSQQITVPNMETAVMMGPVKRFGLMPKPAVNLEQARIIAAYIHDNQIEEPKWFAEHERQMQGDTAITR